MNALRFATDELTRQIQGSQVCLFLDYDGTLAEFAPTPEDVHANPQVLDVLEKLITAKDIHPMIVSGRRLQHLKELVPLEEIILAGTYGIEIKFPGGEQIQRLDFNTVRPFLEKLKPDWRKLVEHEQGFFLEDKGWTLALHARFAEDGQARIILTSALAMVKKRRMPDLFQILGGHKFLEIAPRIANKGEVVEYLLGCGECQACVLIYMGDDDKDEDAFRVVKKKGGIGIRVGKDARTSAADYRLATPAEARRWLARLVRERLV